MSTCSIYKNDLHVTFGMEAVLFWEYNRFLDNVDDSILELMTLSVAHIHDNSLWPDFYLEDSGRVFRKNHQQKCLSSAPLKWSQCTSPATISFEIKSVSVTKQPALSAQNIAYITFVLTVLICFMDEIQEGFGAMLFSI